MQDKPLIEFVDCRVGGEDRPLLTHLSWALNAGECWLVTGPNGGGKTAFARALAGELPVVPGSGGRLVNALSGKALSVSMDRAAALIEHEAEIDESEYVEGGVDPGTLARDFLLQVIPAERRSALDLAGHPAIRACGCAPYLERGLKRLSTGEIRRLMLAQALLAEPELLVLDEPYEGLDADSRVIVRDLIEALARGTAEAEEGRTSLVLVSDRFENIPAGVNRVIELRERKLAFAASRAEFEARLAARAAARALERESLDKSLLEGLGAATGEAENLASQAAPASDQSSAQAADASLVDMRGVTVAWSGREVLSRLSWEVRRGEHWLIRGPNGSGKTTLLELITGDNPQVFCNDVRLFGRRRGTGETIWDIKKRLGIVSYRLHLEYRSLGGLCLEDVLVSGFHDSIGLYEEAMENERALARRWLGLAGFEGRWGESFGELSYGEQRAVIIARSAIKKPELLILDEPCHGLDEEHRERVLTLLEAIAERGDSTLLHVTHDPTEVLACERRILELRPGQSPMYAVLER